MFVCRSSSYVRRAGRAVQYTTGVPRLSLHAVRPTLSSHRHFSDNLLGYSPMGGAKVNDPNVETKMPTAKDVSTSGGVWAPTSAKREKILELKLALKEGQIELDDAATPEQKLDLDLADGLVSIVKTVDMGGRSNDLLLEEFDVWLESSEKDFPEQLDRAQWEMHLMRISQKVESIQQRRSKEGLREVRDFHEWENSAEEPPPVDGLNSVVEPFDACVLRYQLRLIQAAANHLSKSWDELTTMTDADVDRAAVRDGELELQASTLPREKLHAVLRSFATGSCADRARTIWHLIDRDDDGLLDKIEMERVAKFTVAPIKGSLETFFQDCIEAYPVRAPLPESGPIEAIPEPKGRSARRKETKMQKRLSKLFNNAAKVHFQDEVEMPHRLRCIYAWANKAHQNNQTESVLVDSHGASSVLGAGRKRYVELDAKIAYTEFLQVQQEHFTQLDRVGEEIIKSFRQDLLVDQGKGRQNKELQRDCIVFLSVVSIVDLLIISL